MKKKLWLIPICIVGLALLAVIGYFSVQLITYAAEAEEFDISGETMREDNIVVLDYNVRCFSTDDNGKKSWFRRASMIMNQIRELSPDIMTFQEVAPIQQKYFNKYLVGYDCVFIYRDDKFSTEACPIFYRADRFEKVSEECFWLSETPDVMSKGWGANYCRICSSVVLKDKTTQKQFVVYNTHLDHRSVDARINGIDLIIKKSAELGNISAILTGDLNEFENSDTYKKATSAFLDSRYVAEKTETGEFITYQGYGKKLTTPNTPMDFCFVSKTGIDVSSYEVLDYKVDGKYCSDHYAVVVNLKLS